MHLTKLLRVTCSNKATNAFKNHARTYDDPKLVSALLKVGADDTPAIAAEKIFDRIVMKGSIDDINNLKKVILTSDKSVRQQGLESLKKHEGGNVKLFA